MEERILLISTHPSATNGYSNVVNSMLDSISKNNVVIVYGFHGTENHLFIENENVILHTVETDLGIDQINQFIKLCNPSKLIIYNDPYVVYSFLNEINKIQKTFEIIVYLDLVYKNSKKFYIEYLNTCVDKMCVFLYCWEKELINIGYKNSITIIPHCANKNIKKIDKQKCQEILGLDPNYVYLLNLNRNTPRKRYDIFIKGLSQFYKNNPNSNVKVICSCERKNVFDLHEIMEYEKLEQDNIIFIESPGTLSNEYINYLYNATDVGINTCDGEGFGLCNFEHASVGKPQIVPNHDSLMEIYENHAQYIDTNSSYYNDSTRDSLSGIAYIPCYESVAKCIESYLSEEMRMNDGKNIENLLQKKYSMEEFKKNINMLM